MPDVLLAASHIATDFRWLTLCVGLNILRRLLRLPRLFALLDTFETRNFVWTVISPNLFKLFKLCTPSPASRAWSCCAADLAAVVSFCPPSCLFYNTLLCSHCKCADSARLIRVVFPEF